MTKAKKLSWLDRIQDERTLSRQHDGYEDALTNNWLRLDTVLIITVNEIRIIHFILGMIFPPGDPYNLGKI